MSHWICCNSCFAPPSADRKLAVTTCGHIICNVCYQKGNPGKCLICSTQCQVSPLSDKSSSNVKALFSDIKTVANKYTAEISKVMMFQSRHQKRLLTHYQQRNEKLEEVLVKMKQEMQQMKRKLNEQSGYITQLENSLQHKSTKPSAVPQTSRGSYTPHGHNPVHQIPYNSPVSLSRHSSVTNISENMEVDERNLFRRPNSAPRLSIRPPQDGRMGGLFGRTSNQNMPASHSACSATASRFQEAPLTPEMSYRQRSAWKSPIFKPPASFRCSMSSLAGPPP